MPLIAGVPLDLSPPNKSGRGGGQGRVYVTRHVIGCRLTQKTRVRDPVDDIMSEVCLPRHRMYFD